MKMLDAYSLKARYYPTVIVVSPLCLVVLAVGSGVWDPIKGLVGAIVSTLGMAFVMDQIGRDQGKKKEPRVFAYWGGKPTTRILRHRDTTLDPITRKRYHERLGVLVPGIRIPTAKEEADDPDAADSVYESCATFLRQNTRGSEFPLIYQENTNYGFRRNLWGMRASGILIAVLGTLGSSALTAWCLVSGRAEWLVAAICATVCVILLVLWIFRFTADWVRIPAEEYARQLVAAYDTISTKQTGQHKETGHE